MSIKLERMLKYWPLALSILGITYNFISYIKFITMARAYGIPSYYFSDTNRVDTTIKCIELVFLFIVLFTLPFFKFLNCQVKCNEVE